MREASDMHRHRAGFGTGRCRLRHLEAAQASFKTRAGFLRRHGCTAARLELKSSPGVFGLCKTAWAMSSGLRRWRMALFSSETGPGSRFWEAWCTILCLVNKCSGLQACTVHSARLRESIPGLPARATCKTNARSLTAARGQ